MKMYNNFQWNELIIYKFVNKFQYKNLCVFAHFDKYDTIDEHVILYIKSLYESGFDIIFVTTCENMEISELNKIRDFSSIQIIRKNEGYDFGSYRTGIIQCNNLLDYESLILTNDSVFAPIVSLDKMFEIMKNKEYDLWGITDNYEISYHIQSYFVYFSKKVLYHPNFLDFFEQIYVLDSKQGIIERYEIGMSKFYENLGLRIGALASFKDLIEYTDGRKLNSTLYLWDILIKEFNVPIIKVELLRDNPNNVNISNLKQFIERNTNYDFTLIENYLKRIK